MVHTASRGAIRRLHASGSARQSLPAHAAHAAIRRALEIAGAGRASRLAQTSSVDAAVPYSSLVPYTSLFRSLSTALTEVIDASVRSALVVRGARGARRQTGGAQMVHAASRG